MKTLSILIALLTFTSTATFAGPNKEALDTLKKMSKNPVSPAFGKVNPEGHPLYDKLKKENDRKKSEKESESSADKPSSSYRGGAGCDDSNPFKRTNC